MYIRDTIAAICTPVGEGGIGIVRISGDSAARIGAAIFKTTKNGGFPSHRFSYGSVVAPDGERVDEGFAVLMQAPNSYTKEDVFEIQCHGGILVTRKVLDLALASGARIAAPGEFTKRAFLNGRIDLLQAEAIIDVIRSKTESSLKMAEHQREGLLSGRVTEIRDSIRYVLAMVEAHIDFPDEDIELPVLDEMKMSVVTSMEKLSVILSTYSEGKVLRDGVSVAIAGKPNVGKSSLLNTLLMEERAIVTETPGTTRDVIEEILNIDGLPVRLLDTAGIRETFDKVEQIGIDLALGKISQADLVLFILDRSAPIDSDDLRILSAVEGMNLLLVRNKSDLPDTLSLPKVLHGHQVVDISTLTGEGIAELRHQIYSAFISGAAPDNREFVALSQARHRDALQKAIDALDRVSEGLVSSGLLEILSVDLRDALHAIGEITGETTPDDVLDLIFSKFCIGK
jgi:tRNA modification GTPase